MKKFLSGAVTFCALMSVVLAALIVADLFGMAVGKTAMGFDWTLTCLVIFVCLTYTFGWAYIVIRAREKKLSLITILVCALIGPWVQAKRKFVSLTDKWYDEMEEEA